LLGSGSASFSRLYCLFIYIISIAKKASFIRERFIAV
jgi:hypothetical protein